MYLASLGFTVLWFSASQDQMKQPKKYMKQLIDNSYLKYLTTDVLKESVFFESGGMFEIKNLTEKNARSGRADVIIYDEEAQAEEDAYEAAKGILTVSPLGLIIHISTARKGTIFENNFKRLKLRELKHGERFCYSHAWYEIDFLNKNREWYEEERERLRKEGKEWLFRQEHECSFELPTGAIFQNVVGDVYDERGDLKDIQLKNKLDYRIVSGMDWNPVAGHWLVAGKWTKDFSAFVVVESRRLAVGYTHLLRNEVYENLKQYATYGKRLCMESGGINEEYVSWFKNALNRDRNKRDMYVLYEEWDSQGTNKVNACLHLEDKTLYIDEVLFPDLFEQVSNAHWKEDATQAEVEKDPAHSPHALDAFLHATNKRLLKSTGMIRSEWFGSSKE